ncbi:hypothetical protein [Blastococcus sp. SYSU D01042]
MTGLLPDPVPLDPPPGDPRALDDLAGRLGRAGALLGELGDQVSGDAGAAPSWAGRDATAARDRVRQAGGLAREAAGAQVRAGARLALHADRLADARRRLARLRQAQEEDYGAAAARLGGVLDPADSGGGPGALEALHAAESARRRVAGAIREEVARDAAATAALLDGCGPLAGAGGSGGPEDTGRHLAELLPGWGEAELEQRGRDLAAVLRAGDAVAGEAAARALLPQSGEEAVAAGVLTGLGAAGFRDVLRRLGAGELSERSATARLLSAVLGAPVPPAHAAAVARVRDARHVDPGELRTLDADLVALGMGVVLAAARADRSPGPPLTTVREWGRQIIARERATGGERIVDRVRLPPSDARPGDPVQEVLERLSRADAAGPAATLLRAQPTWSLLLARPWDDGGASLGAVVERAGGGPAPAADVALRSGLRALAAGLGDDGDPAAWTVDRATAAAIAPALAGAVAARPDVVVRPLQAAADGAPGQRSLLRGLGHLSAQPTAAAVLDRGLAGAAPVVTAGWTAAREYGQRLEHALDEFAAQEQAERRMHLTDTVKEALSLLPGGGRVVVPLVAVGAVLADLDGTWDESVDRGGRFTAADAVRAAGGGPATEQAYRDVAALLGTPHPPASPPVDWRGLAGDVLPGRRRSADILDRTGDTVQDIVDDIVEDRREGPVPPKD